MISCFLSELAKSLRTSLGDGWKQEVVVVLDGASYHRSIETRKAISQIGMAVIMSAPYSYASAPAELWFAAVKRGDFNPELIKSTKS